jgi:methionyl-tRNA formyltransferase
MEKGLDTGPMLLSERVPIVPHATAAGLRGDLATLGAQLALRALGEIETLQPQPQPGDGVTYAKKLTREEERIDWTKPARVLERQVRAIPSWFEAKGERIKVLASMPVEGRGAPGTVLDMPQDSGPTIACGEGALRLAKLQRPGRGPVEADAFLRGFALPAGTVLPSN